jgi:PAS domain-containing protein
MSHLRALDADVEAALEPINVPAYVIDKHGIIRWINPAARKVVGDVRGRQYTSVCAPEETRHAREVFAQKVVGGAKVTDASPARTNAWSSTISTRTLTRLARPRRGTPS